MTMSTNLNLDTLYGPAEVLLNPAECADVLRRHLEEGPPPSAFQRLAAAATG